MKAVNQATFNIIKKMSLNDFNRWIDRIFKDAYQEDMNNWYEKGFEFGLNYGAVWMEDDLFRLLRSEGIGAERANRIIDKMLKEDK
jgi:hypothetical protein